MQSGVYRGVSAQERVEQRRARLIEATLEVWADPSRRTTMTAICQEAGLSERYFYESFSDLDDAQRTVLEAVAEQIERETTQAREAAGSEPLARVEATMRSFAELIASDPRRGRVAIIEAGAMPQLRHRRTELLRHFAHLCAEEARRTFEDTQRTENQDEIAGLVFIGGMAELITAWLEDALAVSTEEIVSSASAAFVGLYG